jgi:hypothetical protein
MKTKKFTKKLNLNKLTLANLADIKGAAIPRTLFQYTCPDWTVCPYYAC